MVGQEQSTAVAWTTGCHSFRPVPAGQRHNLSETERGWGRVVVWVGGGQGCYGSTLCTIPVIVLLPPSPPFPHSI